MDDISDHHYTISRFHLSLIGLWPFENTWFATIRRLLAFGTLTTCLIIQFIAYYIKRDPMDITLKYLPYIVIVSIFLVKFQTFFLSMKGVKGLIELIGMDWKVLYNEEEQKIYGKYADTAKAFNIIFTSAIYPAMLGFVITLYLSTPIDNQTNFNGSHTIKTTLEVQYFVDQERYFIYQEKYYGFVLLHFNAVAFVGGATLVGTESMTILFSHHIYGLLQVVCYRISKAIDENIFDTGSSKHSRLMHEGVISAIYMHKRAMNFRENVENCLMFSYLILLSFGVLSLSLSLLRLSQAIQTLEQFEDFVVIVCFVLAHVGYFYLGNYVGQKLTDHSFCVFENIYQTQWYNVPVYIRKLLLFVMCKTVKACYFDVGGIFNPSFEGFTELTKLSVSYFMVIYNTQ